MTHSSYAPARQVAKEGTGVVPSTRPACGLLARPGRDDMPTGPGGYLDDQDEVRTDGRSRGKIDARGGCASPTRAVLPKPMRVLAGFDCLHARRYGHDGQYDFHIF